MLAAAAAAEQAGACAGRVNPTRSHSLLARAASLRLNPFGGAGGGDVVSGGGGSSGGDAGGPWEALDVVVKEAVKEAFAAADKEFIATSRLPEASERQGEHSWERLLLSRGRWPCVSVIA